MLALHPLRVVGPALLAVSVAIAAVVAPVESTLADAQVALVATGAVLFSAAGFRNPLRARLGWRPLLGLGEVAVGVAIPLGVLGTGVHADLAALYGLVAVAATVALAVVIGSQVLQRRTTQR